MAVPIISRQECGLKPPTAPLALMPQPDGWVVHWVGGHCDQTPTEEDSKALWRNIQAESLAGIRGEHYVDIPYSFGVDLAGRALEGRGWPYKSGANGSSNYNAHAWAVCILSGPGNQLTDAAVATVTALTQEGAQRRAAVSYVKGHKDVYPTQCPGPEAYAHLADWTNSLHDPPLRATDWATIAWLVRWCNHLDDKPLKFGEEREGVPLVKDLLRKHGYKKIEDGQLYGQIMREAIHDWKLRHPETFPNPDGKVCGGICVRSLLRP